VWAYGDPGFFELPVEQVRAVNTIGCGDAVTAGMAHELHRGTPLAQAIDKGLACGKANAMTLRPGTILGE
jgi:1-phosphofructokinase/tagatose 6-phosphate kinase